MIFFNTKISKLRGANYAQIKKQADVFFNQIMKKSKRKPYIRSAYFKKQKVFFDYFWVHLLQKHHRDRTRRLAFFSAAIVLIKNSKNHPFTIQNPYNQSELLHRFGGVTKEGYHFLVQIKENKRTGAKYFMSCFPQE